VIRHENVGDGGRVCLITLDRQERRNAMGAKHWAELTTAVHQATEGGSRTIVIAGAGSVFCAGADFEEVGGDDLVSRMEATFAAVRESPVPVLAYLNGPAVGAGALLTVSCDLRVASTRAFVSVPAVEIGMPVHPGTIARMVALAGLGAARGIFLGGERISAERAHTLGLVNRIGELEDALAWAEQIASFAPLAMRYLKQQLQVENPPESADYPDVVRRFAATEDFAESTKARQEGRPPAYLGR
jgi:enoyl-CoA hydratase